MSLQNAIGHNGNGNGHNGAVSGTNSTGVVITHSTTPLPAGVHLPLYMDNHATTPLDPRVLEAMMPYLTGKFGNAASRNHQFGWEAEKAVEIAREQIARLIGASAKEIIFTSGATESDNLALKGIAEMYRERGNHIITQATEHKAILDTCKKLEKQGFRVTYLPVLADGLIDLDDLRRAIVTEGPEKTILVSIMFANNEIGVIQPIAEIGKLCHEKGVFFHTDAVQAVGKVPVDVQAMNIDVLSISAHKLYGPKGVGALYVRRRNPPEQINGGGHERGMRSGTLNVPGIVGLGAACEICMSEMAAEAQRETELRDNLRAKLEAALDYVQVNGNMEHHLPGNLNMSFVYVEGESLLMGINDIAVSSGSACTSATLEPSYVLKALGLGDEIAHSSIRFGLGRFNTKAEVDYVADKIIEVVRKLRELSPLYEMVQEGIDLTKIEWAAH
jgi:cysteine desulfurase